MGRKIRTEFFEMMDVSSIQWIDWTRNMINFPGMAFLFLTSHASAPVQYSHQAISGPVTVLESKSKILERQAAVIFLLQHL
ncbi:unnamed protein product [Anisakis simplex]|uniref:Ovule protein n=1 Tax=Anisakis simplex TaxID=6269 RepID=A0A0M3JRU9_ANISI|nr:unnamed protein product [Anisakis simplex]